MSAADLYKATPRVARRWVEMALRAGNVPFLQSSPGLGKSSIMAAIAKALNLKLIDHRLSTSPPEDLSGLPNFTKDGKAYFAPFTELFPLQGDELPMNYATGLPYDGWLVFLDEFNSAKKDTQAAAYKLILDRKVGQHSLHDNVLVACAGNLDTDRAIVNSLSTAMQSRVIHIEMVASFDEWIMDVALPQNYDPRIIAYLSQHPEKLMDFDPAHKNNTFCCPRTWEFMDRMVNGNEVKDEDTGLYGGTITHGTAASFVQFTKVWDRMPRFEDIIANPHSHSIPNEMDMVWAVTSSLLSHLNEKTIDPILTYVDRLDKPMRILFYRSVMQQHPELRHNSKYTTGLVSIQRDLRAA